MFRFLIFAGAAVIILHGLVHLMGFVAYWPLAELAELPYKTTLLNGRLPMDPSGMRFYSVVWLVTAVAFAAAAIGLLTKQSWWLPLLGTAVILSLVITVLDWNQAWRGAIVSLIILIPLLLVAGLRVQPRPFSPYPEPTQTLTAVPLPSDLPAPVARYYQTITSASLSTSMGEEVPVVETAVISGRGRLRIKGVTFPARFRFTHIAGQDYRHTIEATFFGYPVMKVNEWYLDGQARLELPVGVIENEPKIDAAANLSLWGEAVWLPSIFITDPRVRWEAVDETSAHLIVPSGDGEESFTVTFDPQTGLLRTLEAMRWKEPASETKLLWTNEVLGWRPFHGVLLPSPAATTWADEGTPWAIWTIEEVVYNVDVGEYIRTEGR